VLEANSGLGAPALGDTVSGAAHDDVKVHSENADCRVVLDAEVNVLLDTEAKVASLGEVPLAELVLLDLETSLEAAPRDMSMMADGRLVRGKRQLHLFGLGTADGDVDGDLFVPLQSNVRQTPYSGAS
jgi:hypothetical protein